MPLELVRGDITRQDTDAIVNAANQSLLGGGGVDGAIHRAAGPKLKEACRALGERPVRCPTGEARITDGFDLPARHVIHAVGPRWRGGDKGEEELLASAYRSSLTLAAEHELESVALPSISTGAYGYPVQQAAAVAIREVRAHLHRATSVTLVRMVAFSEDDLRVYQQAVDA